AAASEEARRTLRYVEPLSDARTPLADFFSILLGASLGEEAILADSGRAGGIAAGAGWVRRPNMLNIL
ncbi:MAG: hypothetical protein SGJ26_16745, partial [Nitrospirota bacterium]|nr:hypothetical protein [Nitrospirota bacterium]